MNVDEESDYEEEEFLIYADFKNQLGPLELKENSAVKIIGLDNDPIAEVNGNIFKGTYDYSVGTCIFFEKDLDASPSDPLFESSCRQRYKYIAKTNKVINFERIFVESKLEKKNEDPTSCNTSKLSGENDKTVDQGKVEILPNHGNLRIDMSYEEAINQFPPYENNS